MKSGRTFFTQSKSQGAVLVELAIGLPLLITIYLLYADIMRESLAEQRHRLALMNVISSAAELPAPLQLGYGTVGGSVRIRVDERSTDGDVEEILDGYINFFQTTASEIGNVPGIADTELMLRLYYIQISDTTGKPTAVVRAGGDEHEYYLGGSSTGCFSSDQAALEEKIDSYAASITEKIFPGGGESPDPPIGILSYRTTLYGTTYEARLPSLPVFVYLACSRVTKRLGQSKAFTTAGVFFPDHLLGA